MTRIRPVESLPKLEFSSQRLLPAVKQTTTACTYCTEDKKRGRDNYHSFIERGK